MRNLVNIVLAVAMSLAVSGCSQPLNQTTTGAIAGTAIGSGLGAIIGGATGNAGAGTAIGAGVGAVTGTLVGSMLDRTDEENRQIQGRVAETDAQLAENQRLINELRKKGVDVSENRRGVSIHLPDILFGFNRSELTPDAARTVQEIAGVIRQRASGRAILVEGHADAIGGEDYNVRLSGRRADSVAQALIRGGVSPREVRSKGFGELRPIASNDSETGRHRNRRVEVVIER